MTGEGGEALAHAQALFDEPCIELDQKLDGSNTERAIRSSNETKVRCGWFRPSYASSSRR